MLTCLFVLLSFILSLSLLLIIQQIVPSLLVILTRKKSDRGSRTPERLLRLTSTWSVESRHQISLLFLVVVVVVLLLLLLLLLLLFVLLRLVLVLLLLSLLLLVVVVVVWISQEHFQIAFWELALLRSTMVKSFKHHLSCHGVRHSDTSTLTYYEASCPCMSGLAHEARCAAFSDTVANNAANSMN